MNRFLFRGIVATAGMFFAAISVGQNGPAVVTPMAEALRSMTIQQQGLNNAALNLSRPQKAEINKIVAAYVEEQLFETERLGPAQKRPEHAARTALANLTDALSTVMNGEQRAIWEAAKRSANTSATSAATPRQ